VDEPDEQRFFYEDEPEADKPEDQQPMLTQRELVRASLLRCPPSDPAQSPRH
jgi:hypothetical protein